MNNLAKIKENQLLFVLESTIKGENQNILQKIPKFNIRSQRAPIFKNYLRTGVRISLRDNFFFLLKNFYLIKYTKYLQEI